MNGTLFPLCGEFAGAIFKFTIELPISYPCEAGKINDHTFPEVVLESLSENKIMHPFIDEILGYVDLSALKEKHREGA